MGILQARILEWVAMSSSRESSQSSDWTRSPTLQADSLPSEPPGKPLTVWLATNYGKFLKRWKYQTTWPASWEICVQVRKQQLELDMEQTGSRSGKEYVKAVYCYPAYLTYMQSTSWEMMDWMKHKLESSLPGEISITSDRQRTPPLWQKAKRK